VRHQNLIIFILPLFYQVKSAENSFSFTMMTWQEAPQTKTKQNKRKTDKKETVHMNPRRTTNDEETMKLKTA